MAWEVLFGHRADFSNYISTIPHWRVAILHLILGIRIL